MIAVSDGGSVDLVLSGHYGLDLFFLLRLSSVSNLRGGIVPFMATAGSILHATSNRALESWAMVAPRGDTSITADSSASVLRSISLHNVMQAQDASVVLRPPNRKHPGLVNNRKRLVLVSKQVAAGYSVRNLRERPPAVVCLVALRNNLIWVAVDCLVTSLQRLREEARLEPPHSGRGRTPGWSR